MGNRTSLGNEQYAVNKYIGTAYDHVKNVSENIEDVKIVADALGDDFPEDGLDTLVENIDNINTVVNNLSDVNTAADNILEIVEVADNIDAVLDAPNQAELARKWAQESEDIEVLPNEYSSYHYSKKAEEQVGMAEDQVTLASEQATIATDAADSIGRYQGLWPDTGGNADKGDTYQTQVSGTPTGQYFTALQNTAVDPVGDDVNWREVVSVNGLARYSGVSYKSIDDMFTGSPLANAVGDICNASGSLFIKESESLPVDKDNYRALNNPSIFAFGGKVDGVTDDTAAFLSMVTSGFEVVELGQGTMLVDEFVAALTNDLTIKGNGCVIKNISNSPVQVAAYFTVSGYNLRIDDTTFDADNVAFQCLRIQNESNSNIKDVELNNIKAFNAYRSSQVFQGGDGIFVRGGFRRVIINNPEVKDVKMATGAGIAGSEGVSGITVVQNFAQTLMPRYVEINNPYVEDIYSEDATYTSDQDGAKLFGIDTEFMEEGSCRINGGTFKNCWGRSLKFQRPDAIVNGVTFIRDSGNAVGGGNSEIDFQRGGGTVRDIICKYTNFNPTTIVSTYQNQYDTYKFLVDGVSVSLDGTTLNSVVQRYSQATPDKAIPLVIKNIDITGPINQVLRYLTQNSSLSDVREQAVLENIYFGQANAMAQVYGNDTGQRVDIYVKNINTSGTNVDLIDEGTFGNAVEVRLYQDYIRGFNSRTDSFFVAELTAQSGTVTLNSNENRLHYMRKGRVVSVYGQIRVLSVSSPTGTLSLKLPFPSQRGTQLSSVVSSSVIVSESVSKNCNDFSLSLPFDSDTAEIRDISGNAMDGSAVAEQMKNNTRLYLSFQYVAEDDF